MASDSNRQANPIYTPMMRDMAEHNRPRERLMQVGERAVSTAELLAIILRTGSGGENVLRLAERLLITFKDLPGIARASLAQWMEVKGVGPAKAVEIKAALEIGRRLLTSALEEVVFKNIFKYVFKNMIPARGPQTVFF